MTVSVGVVYVVTSGVDVSIYRMVMNNRSLLCSDIWLTTSGYWLRRVIGVGLFVRGLGEAC